MKVHTEFHQGSAEWCAARLGKVTASGAESLLTPKFEIRKGEMPKSYMYAKVAEAFRGVPLPGFSGSWDTEVGKTLEDDARKLFCLLHDGPRVYNVGMCEHDDGRSACSPDALIGDHSGLEIKAPRAETHLRYLLEGGLPPDYAVQIHFSLYVTGRSEWVFMSYARRFPPFILTVQRDESKCAVIAEALSLFYGRFDEALQKLKAAS